VFWLAGSLMLCPCSDRQGAGGEGLSAAMRELSRLCDAV